MAARLRKGPGRVEFGQADEASLDAIPDVAGGEGGYGAANPDDVHYDRILEGIETVKLLPVVMYYLEHYLS